MVSDDIVVPLFREELDGKPTDITNSVSATLFAACSAPTEKNWGLLADTIEKIGRRKARDIIGNLELAPCAGRFGMNDSGGVNWLLLLLSGWRAPLRDPLPVEMG